MTQRNQVGDLAAGSPAGCEGPPEAIRAVNLTKVFGNRVCVDHLNFSVRRGELYALLGDNGAGKTTTINMLTTLLAPTEGRFYIGGIDGLQYPERVKSLFGVVSQDIAIYQELTGWENLAFIAQLHEMPKELGGARIQQLLRQAGLADRANDQAGQYSEGMQRKLTIACAILHQPQVLFMDEPTVGLDPYSRRQIWATLRDLRSHGVTVLLTTHYLEEAELLADRIGIIRQGRLVIEGTIDELRDRIQGIRSISIRLAKVLGQEQLEAGIERLKGRLASAVKHDPLRNSIFITQPRETQLARSLRTILDWLEEEQIPFTKFATSEPNLEEVFLSIAAGQTIEPEEDEIDSHVE